ncbi:MAG: hypothetical protein MUF23_13630 [Pirellula sp.]|nr:hypothetical protein [Pirellula sp.]
MIPSKTRAFFGGLHDWIGTHPPTCSDISEVGFIAYGVMHIKAITTTGGGIIGECPISDSGDFHPTLLSEHGGNHAMVLRGSIPVRPAANEEWGKLPVLGIWGYNFISSLAEAKLASRGK